MGRLVYSTGARNGRFHETADCPLLLAGQNTWERPREIQQVDLETLPPCRSVPCRKCYPDAPKRLRVRKILCLICGQRTPRPCEHNGGVVGPRGTYVWPWNPTLVKSARPR